MQINLLKNSLISQQASLKSMVSKRAELNIADTETARKSALDAVAQDVIEKTATSGATPVYLTNTMAQEENGLLQEVMSLRNERNQNISELVACGIEPTKAKYIVSSKQGEKGLAALEEYKNKEASEVIENSTKETEEKQSSESSEEVVEEQIEEIKTDSSSGERVKEVKVVKRVRVITKSTSAADVDMKVQSVKAVKGQYINIKV